MSLCPLRFRPRLIEKMWGGRELERVCGKRLPADKLIGESWEVFDFPPGVVGPDARTADDGPDNWISATVLNGPTEGRTLHDLMQSHRDQLLGDARGVRTPHGEQFPLLVKFLDARQDLSVQVHPPDRYLRSNSGAHLKNECWYVVSRDPGARILAGTTRGTDRDAFARSLGDGTCERLLNSIAVDEGDCFYLPSGTVHALGAGIVAAEVQTPSDTTYRVFDFNRVEPATGEPRRLHVDQALACIDFSASVPQRMRIVGCETFLVGAPQFAMSGLRAQNARVVSRQHNRPMVLINLGGEMDLMHAGGDPMTVRRGEVIVVPACIDEVTLTGGVVHMLAAVPGEP